MAGRPNQPLTIQAAIEASGDLDPGAIYVSFYASADTQITESDYYLGQINLALSANSWTTVTLKCTLPVSIPAGTYHVGWIIDPDNLNSETNEDNNAAFNKSSLMTVAGTSRPILYVDVNARGVDDGSSWEDAFHSLQDALAAAVGGGEIRVADGVYRPDRGAGVKRGDRQAAFELNSGVAILGGYAGAGEPDPDARDIETWQTILSGDLNGDDQPAADPFALWLETSKLDNSRHVVTAINADRTAILDGVQITGGCADGWFDGAAAAQDSRGGGMYVAGGGPRLQRCVFSGNWASTQGGAVYATNSRIEMLYCTLCANTAVSSPQDHREAGGAVFATGGDLTLTGCTLRGNLSSGSGGALALAGSRLSAANCCLHANHAKAQAGAVHTIDSRAVLVNCTIAGNRQDTVTSVIVAESLDGADSELDVANCILWNDGQQIASQADVLVMVAYSDVRGGSPGIGNLDADPMFADPHGRDGVAGTEDDDLRLRWNSPCIDAGSITLLPQDTADVDNDGNVTESVSLDCAGSKRVAGAEVDMGAFEAVLSGAALMSADP